MSDVDALARLLARMLPEIDLGVALYHGEFAAVSALMEHHGVPIDMEIFNQLADSNVWRAVRDEMVPAIDAQYGVYTRRNDKSDWTFQHGAFVAYLKREGIEWPTLETGALNMKRKTFEDMSKGFPQLEQLRQLQTCPRQDAKSQACGRQRWTQQNRAVAFPSQDFPHSTQSIALDIFAGGMAAFADQTRTGDGDSLC